MSGIAGIFNLDGRPVDPALLHRMTDVIAQRGPDGVGHWIDGPVGLGHRMLHTTPESLHETQPLLDETGDLCLTLDGRVDNREELKAALESHGARLRDDTDAELVLRAYECWGEDCPAKIIGDFAFAIWDKRKRQLFCARDFLGRKPFYYYANGRTVLFGSELQQFFQCESVPHEPNEGMIGEYLACALTNNEETLYKDILRLPPAHNLIVKTERLHKARYWDIDPDREVHHKTDDEYAAHFLQIFREAVRCRLRSSGKVGVELSGGLDSSSVVAVVHSLNREEGLANEFETFSMVFPGLPCDESDYIQEAVRHWNLKSNVVRPDESETNHYAEEAQRYRDFPQYPNGVMSYSLTSLAREKGIRVILTGGGGDDWFTGSFYHYADFLKKLKITALVRQLYYDRQFNQGSGIPAIIFPPLAILRVGFWPLIPQAMRRVIKRALGREDTLPSWIGPQFALRTHLLERISRQTVKRRFPNFAQEDIYSALVSGWLSHGSELASRPESLFNLEKRQPFLDRRLIEFALALPEEQRWRLDQPKFIIRHAMRGTLPERIRKRLTKADFSHAFAEAFRALGGASQFDSLTIESMGWIDGAQVRKMYQQMIECYAQSDKRYISHIWQLWMILGIELWFNVVFNRKALLTGGLGISSTGVQPVYTRI